MKATPGPLSMVKHITIKYPWWSDQLMQFKWASEEGAEESFRFLLQRVATFRECGGVGEYPAIQVFVHVRVVMEP